MDDLISLEEFSKIYYMGDVEVPALKEVDLKIRKGEFVVVCGPSGSGKSTMMNLIGCLDLPTSGIVKLEDRDITNYSESELAQIRGKKIGFVFQQFNLIPTLNALKNVTLPLEFQDMPDDEALERAEMILEKVGLEKRKTHFPSQLSGGEQQRVSIARALAVNPEIILADEPTGNLDSKTGAYIMKFFKELNENEGKTIIIITHDKNLAKQGERIVNLKDGKIA